jgi:predicted permease
MHTIFSNMRYGLRQFRQAPVFTAAAVLTLAIGIGGTTAIFSLIDAVMLRSLPVDDPARLYRVGDGIDCCVIGGPQDRWSMYSYRFYQRLQQNMPEFEETTAFEAGVHQMSVRRMTEQSARPLTRQYVSGSYFSVLGVRPLAGRLFSAEDDRPAAEPVAVLSYHAWQEKYGADPTVIGSNFVIDSHPSTVIGIAPPGFFGDTLREDPPELWLPVQQEALLDGKGALLNEPAVAWLRVIGRLKPGATTVGMSARLTTLLRQWLQTDGAYPADWLEKLKRSLPRQFITVVPAGSGVLEMKEVYGRSLAILLCVCALVLLIACANVANLLLARAAARRGQTALRLAVGASRRQVVGQALSESLLLACLGGVAGLAVAVAASKLLLLLAFHSAQFLPISVSPSLPALGFCFALSLMTGVVFGAAPAWFATRTDPIESLRGASRSTQDRSGFARSALLVVQSMLSVVLVGGAMMLSRSLANLEHQNFGFETSNRVIVQINAPATSYAPERLNSHYREMQARLEGLPGIEQAGLAKYNPLTDNSGFYVFVEGHGASMAGNINASFDRVSASYLSALGQPVLRGRSFTDADNENTALVALVNVAFVRRFFPDEDPLDRHFGLSMPENAGMFRIIGVVRDAKYWAPREPVRPMYFLPLMQWAHYPQPMMQSAEIGSHFIHGILLVTRKSPADLEPVLTKTLAEIDASLTITSVRRLEEQVALVFDQQRAVASLAGLFGLLALMLAAVGLYGVTAYIVTRRTNEIGIRMALGADGANVVRLILRGAFRRVAVGLLLGIPLAIVAGCLLRAQLYDVHAWDPPALVVAAVSLGICGLAAAIIPALRAAAIDPIEALRTE